MNALIVGYGSAGKRHKDTLHSIAPWVKVRTADTNGKAEYPSIESALVKQSYDIVIIATPPENHLYQIQIALDDGAWVMCEKPLCGLGQMDFARQIFNHKFADRVMVSYNYRFNHDLNNMKSLGTDVKSVKRWWYLYCSQHRPYLKFPLLLDHISHDVDILRHKSGYELLVESANYYDRDGVEKWTVRGQLFNGDKFEIHETVDKERSDVERKAVLVTPFGWLNINRDKSMYIAMWDKFFHSMQNDLSQSPGIGDAIKTQKVLEDINGYYIKQK